MCASICVFRCGSALVCLGVPVHVCVFRCACVSIYVCLGVYMYVHKGQRMTSGCFLIVHHTFGLRSLTSEADRLSSKPQHPPLSSPQCGLTINSGCAGF